MEKTTGNRFEVHETNSGEFYFTLHARNGQVIATSNIYSNKIALENGVESVRKNSYDAPIVYKK